MSRLKYYTVLSLEIAIALAVFVCVEMIVTTFRISFDLTPEKSHSLSVNAKEVLRFVTEDLKIIVFIKKEGEQGTIRSLLEVYSRENPHVRYELVNLDRNPGRARKYDVHSYYTTVLEYKGDIIKTGYPMETNITPALARLLDKREMALYFSTGSGENNFFEEKGSEHGFDFARMRLEREGYELKLFPLKEISHIPQDLEALIISGPRQDYSKNSLEVMRQVVDAGRAIIFFLDPVPLPNLEEFLESYGLKLPRRIIADEQGHAQGWDEWTVVVPFINKQHIIASGLTMPALFPLCRPVQLNLPENNLNTPLLGTSETSWAVTDQTGFGNKPSFNPSSDTRGPVTVGVTRQLESGHGKNARIAVLGNSKFVDNTYIKMLGNGDLFLNLVQWALDENTISLRDKDRYGVAFNLSAGQFAKLQLFCIALPVIILLLGGTITFLKRRQVH
jgi:ABC-type uncharacterized transport system involved in gliding motility auxiliary subunit